jgi:hypothetical protein
MLLSDFDKENRMVKIRRNGVEKNLVDWAQHLGMPYQVLQRRYSRHGADLDKLFAPYKERGGCQTLYGHKMAGVGKKGMGTQAWSLLYWYQGKEQNLHQWAKELGISYKVLEMRVRRGKRGAELFAQPREWKKR